MIKVLPKDVQAKIAAGEVIESPVSIVKELVENSIDAGSTSIVCEIVKGGKDEIRITDNGSGILSDDVEIAFQRHATSKITKAEDLKSLHTLGFRGEALASISAVSRTELITKTEDEKAGTKIIIHGGNIISKEMIGCPVGTTIIVRDLFYNMPAREKFMKSEASEAGKIIDMISRLAITRPDIRFSLISNGKNYFTTSGSGDFRTAMLSVYKDREYSELIPLKDTESSPFIRITGFISRPSFTRTSRRSEFFFVNGRPVKSIVLEKGVDLGYKERLFEGRHPICFIFLDVDPDKLDVNVHPNKREVRFNDEPYVISLLGETIRKTLTGEASIVRATDSFSTKKPDREKTEQINIKDLLYNKKRDEESISINESVSSYFGDPDLRVLGPRAFDFDDLEFGNILFGTYITAWDDNSFYLFDQHAAHERVNYERFVRAYLDEDKMSQLILSPFTFDPPLELKEFEDDWLNILSEMGYGIEEFGDNTYIVREIPVFMTLGEAEEFVEIFIDSYLEERRTKNSIVIDKLITKACKSSIKAHDHIKHEEVQALIDDLKNCENPFSCPHGRPTFIKFGVNDIEKMFKRII